MSLSKDEELLVHCYNSLTGQYGEIANTLLVELLKRRLAIHEGSVWNPTGLQELISPADMRKAANSAWDTDE
jgi:hypothetical protein